MIRNKSISIASFLLLVIVISIFTLSGCSKNDSEAAGARPTQAVQTDTVASAGKENAPSAEQSTKPDNGEGQKQPEQNAQAATPAPENKENATSADLSSKQDNTAMQSDIKETLSKLVLAGTITEEQSTKIASMLQAPRDKGDGTGKATNNQTDSTQSPPPQGNNGDAGQTGTKGSPLGTLVTDGTLTQDQADKVMEAMRQNMPKPQQ